MGKRKKSSRGPQGPKKREPLATVFKCVFCNHESSVTAKIDRKAGIGNLSCKSCQASFQTGINYLSQPVDVYSEWLDACEEVAEGGGAVTNDAAPVSSIRPSQATARGHGKAPAEETYATEGDDFVVDDEPDAEADYDDDDG